MPVRRSSGDSGGVVKVGRKARVSIGNSRGLVDDVSTAGPKSSVVDKARGKKKFAIEGSNGGVRTVGAKKKGSNKVQNRGNSDDDASYLHVNERLTETRGQKKSNLKTQSGGEGFEAALKGNTGHKRKRISADPMVEDKIFDGNVRRSRTKSDKVMAESHLDKVKKVPRGKDRELKDTGRNTFVKENFKSSGVELDEKKIRRGKVMVADKLKYSQDNVSGTEKTKIRDKKRVELNDKKIQRGKVVVADKLKYSQDNVSGNEKTKIRDKKRVPFETQKEDLKQRANGVGFIEKVRKKKDHGKTNLSTDSDLAKDPPKKKRRVIRIDPNDISNKRLDDGIIKNDSTEAKIVLAESTSADISKNAQFRAIIPSPSILSFVEDNFLGRRRDIQFRRAGYNTELSAPLDNIPFSTSSERERIEVPAFRNKLEFFAAAKNSSSFPPPDLPEIAFAGRSNVGKSSLLNALTRQWGVARTSDKPGLTQSINFFKLGTKLCLVDLPGYGFAYAKDEVKEAWEELVKEYVCTRVGLKRVCLLVDTKWGMKPRDHELIDLMERSQTKYQIVLTKTDLNFPIDVARRAMQIEENLKAKKSVVQPLMMVSSKTGAGIRSLRTVLANVARLVRR